jgi:hypothetical protein
MNASAAKRRKKLIDEIGHEFAMASDQAWLAARTESYAAFIKRFRALEREYLCRLERYPKMALDVRRRVAEGIFVEAIVRGLPLAACRNRLNTLAALGYQDVLRRALYELIFIRGAVERRNKRVALHMATALLPSIQRSMNSRQRKRLGKDLLRQTQTWLVELAPAKHL